MKAIYNCLNPVHHYLVKWLGRFSMTILALLVADVLLGVFSRFIIGQQVRWTEEVAIYLLVWVSFIGAAVAYADKAHLGVDYFVEKFHPDVKRLSQRIVHLIVLLFAFFGMVIGGGKLMLHALAGGQVTPAMQMPIGWIYSVLPLSGIFFMLFAFHALVAPDDADEVNELHTPASNKAI